MNLMSAHSVRQVTFKRYHWINRHSLSISTVKCTWEAEHPPPLSTQIEIEIGFSACHPLEWPEIVICGKTRDIHLSSTQLAVKLTNWCCRDREPAADLAKNRFRLLCYRSNQTERVAFVSRETACKPLQTNSPRRQRLDRVEFEQKPPPMDWRFLFPVLRLGRVNRIGQRIVEISVSDREQSMKWKHCTD